MQGGCVKGRWHPWNIREVGNWGGVWCCHAEVGGSGRCESPCGSVEELLVTADVAQRCSDAFEGRSAIGDGLHECVCQCEAGVCDGFVLKDNCVA